MLQLDVASDAGLGVCAERLGSTVRIFLAGELDVSTAPLLQQAVDAAVRTGCALVIDLRDITFSDVVGLHTLEKVAEHSRRDHWRLRIANGFGAVRDTFEAAGTSYLLGATMRDLLDAGSGPRSPGAFPSVLGPLDGGILSLSEMEP